MGDELGKVYLITNKVNDKRYVGITTKKLRRRFNKHVRDNEFFLGKAIKKYGKENFKIELIEKVNIDKLNDREIYWIKKYNTFKGKDYNATAGGCGLKGMKHTEETKQKISNSQKGNFKGKDNPMYGADLSGDNNPMYGKKHKKETKQKISQKALERFKDPQNHPRTKYSKELCLTIYNEYKNSNTSYDKLKEKYNTSKSAIYRIINNVNPYTRHIEEGGG